MKKKVDEEIIKKISVLDPEGDCIDCCAVYDDIIEIDTKGYSYIQFDISILERLIDYEVRRIKNH